MGDVTEMNNLGSAIKELKTREQESSAKVGLFWKNFEEFTGYKPNQQITAFDVVQLMYKFYGEPKK